MWNFEYSQKYVKQYKLLSSDLQIKVKEALASLAKSENPLKLGEYKKSLGAWAYDLDRKNRILYNVRFNDNVIELLRVGSHDKAYKGH